MIKGAGTASLTEKQSALLPPEETASSEHITVLLDEAVEALNIKPDRSEGVV